MIAINHQIRLIKIDSTKNWMIISHLRAHNAFLIQISFVLSVTDTSIIFITQIHHTSREMDHIANSK
jgi:hypothetical protein